MLIKEVNPGKFGDMCLGNSLIEAKLGECHLRAAASYGSASQASLTSA